PSLPRLLFPAPRSPPRPTLFPYTTLFRSRPTIAAHLADLLMDERRIRGFIIGAVLVTFPHPSRSSRGHVRKASVRLPGRRGRRGDRKSTRLNSSHLGISYAVFCLKKKKYI